MFVFQQPGKATIVDAGFRFQGLAKNFAPPVKAVPCLDDMQKKGRLLSRPFGVAM
jgi:hypothetical protein